MVVYLNVANIHAKKSKSKYFRIFFNKIRYIEHFIRQIGHL